MPELHPAVALSPPTRCRDPGRRARTDRSPLQLPHRLSSLPQSKPCRTAPLWQCLPSRSPPPDPEPVLEKRAGIPEGRQARATSTEGLRARAGRLPCARRAPSRLPCRPREGVPPLPPFLVGSLSCGGGSQLLHIWLLLHIYILERASERARESAREGGREGRGRRERSGAGGGGGGESRVYRRHHFYYSGGAVQDLFHCRGIQNKPRGAAARATTAARHCFSPSAPPSPRHPRSIYTLQ